MDCPFAVQWIGSSELFSSMKTAKKLANWLELLVYLAIIVAIGFRILGVVESVPENWAWTLLSIHAIAWLLAAVLFPVMNWLSLTDEGRRKIPPRRYFYELIAALALLMAPLNVLINDLHLNRDVTSLVFLTGTLVVLIWLVTRLFPQYFDNPSQTHPQ
jgi:hypothetical protein